MRFSKQVELKAAALRITAASINEIAANVASGKPAKMKAAAKDDQTRHALTESGDESRRENVGYRVGKVGASGRSEDLALAGYGDRTSE